ncbi:SMI1/KNR4 family protein [Streptomyces sp. NPDC054919]
MVGSILRAPVPPADPPPAVDWAQAERALDAALPADYKRLVETYGDGLFDGTIWLLVPDSAYDDCDLHAQVTARDEVLADLLGVRGQARRPAGGGGGVLPWVFEEGTGAFLYWLARPGQRPEEWTVLYNEGRGPLWEHHDMGCLAFLLAVLTGTAETERFGYLYEVLKPTAHRVATADHILGTAG